MPVPRPCFSSIFFRYLSCMLAVALIVSGHRQEIEPFMAENE